MNTIQKKSVKFRKALGKVSTTMKNMHLALPKALPKMTFIGRDLTVTRDKVPDISKQRLP